MKKLKNLLYVTLINKAFLELKGLEKARDCKPFTKSFFCLFFLLFFLPCRFSFALVVLVNPPLEPNLQGTYVGSRQCKQCHPQQWATWTAAKHSSAYKTLPAEDRSNPACLRCHVTGFGRFSGYVSDKETPYLQGVQCEACHGEGSKHIVSTDEEKRKSITGAKADCDCEAQVTCMGCHNKEHSPDFDYKSFWEKVEH